MTTCFGLWRPSSGQDSGIQEGGRELSLRWLTVQVGVVGGPRSRSSKCIIWVHWQMWWVRWGVTESSQT